MPGPLHILDTMPREQILAWLGKALHGKAHVPLEYQDQPVSGAIAAASVTLEDIARRDLHSAAITLLTGLRTGKPQHAYVSSLLRLVTELEIRDAAIPILRELASDIPALKKRLGWELCGDVLFAMLNLRDLHDADYWLAISEQNPRSFSPVTLAALFDLDPMAALDFLPKLPALANLGDLTALSLDYAADNYQGHERLRFREASAAAAQRCKKQIRDSIETWLAETATPASPSSRSLARLHDALGPLPEAYQRTPAKLCEVGT